MKKFKFSLQSVHELRELKKDEAEQDLAKASARVLDASSRLDDIIRERNLAADSYLQTLLTGNLSPQEAALRANYLDSLARQESEARLFLERLEREREEVRRNAAEAARNAEATTKLRERHLARHGAEVAREEQNLLDEMAMISVARRLTRKL
jgi:flagellar export protein FliJ